MHSTTYLHSSVVFRWCQVVVRGEEWEGGRSGACEGGEAFLAELATVRSDAGGGMAAQEPGLEGGEDVQWLGEVGAVWHL